MRGRITHVAKAGVNEAATFIIELRADGLRVRKKHSRRIKVWPLDSLINGVITGQMDLFLAGTKKDKPTKTTA